MDSVVLYASRKRIYFLAWCCFLLSAVMTSSLWMYMTTGRSYEITNNLLGLAGSFFLILGQIVVCLFLFANYKKGYLTSVHDGVSFAVLPFLWVTLKWAHIKKIAYIDTGKGLNHYWCLAFYLDEIAEEEYLKKAGIIFNLYLYYFRPEAIWSIPLHYLFPNRTTDLQLFNEHLAIQAARHSIELTVPDDFMRYEKSGKRSNGCFYLFAIGIPVILFIVTIIAIVAKSIAAH